MMERYEMADGKIYEIKRNEFAPEVSAVYFLKFYQDGSFSRYTQHVGTYGECRRYVEKLRKEARAVA